MVTRLDAPGVRPLTPPGPAPSLADPRQAAFQRALQPLVGQSLNGQVLAKMDDGSFLVRVADTNARMVLPGGTEVGAELPMTLVSVQPRPTFQVGSQPVQASAVFTPSAQQAPAAPGTPAAAPAPAADNSALLPSQAQPRPGTLPQAGQPAPAAPPATQPPAAAQGGMPANPLAAGAQNVPLPGAAGGLRGGPPAAIAGDGAGPDAAPPGSAAANRPLSTAAALLSKAPLTPAEQLPELGRNAPQATLSPAARAIANVLSTAYTAPGVPVTINGKTPLVAGGAPDPEQLSAGLHRALGDSGLFYESHVAEWAQGKRPLQDLAREPQMQRLAQQQASAGNEALAKLAGGPDLSAAQMINQQLHTHEQARVQWQGEAWPGQPMQWEVRREQQEQQSGGGQDEAASEPVWRSGVRFRFPLLGKVSANVTLAGGQVHLQVESGSDDTAATLRAWAGVLQQAMEAAGAPLSSLSIQAEGGNDGT
ncbi:flagellar hook-length control protein FliK [Massilia sp. SM-13]|uniref:flagellar hook-length control protein FliK n=1 Tax=Pseudoduganella rhizocola TaxID=3382643 RepID=UPI0038B5B2FE